MFLNKSVFFVFAFVHFGNGVFCLNEVLRGQSVLYGIASLTKGGNVSVLCQQHLSFLLDSIESKRIWALKALDASGGPGPGFIYGNNLWHGSHAECSDIPNKRHFEVSYDKVKHAETAPEDDPPYSLGFFMAHLQHNSTLQYHTQLPLEFTIQLGLCAPKSCTPDDISNLLKSYIDNRYLSTQKLYNLQLNVTEIRPLREDFFWMFEHPKFLVLVVIFLAILTLSIIGTCYDVKKHNREKNLITGHRGNINGKQNNISQVELVSASSSEDLKSGTLGEIVQCFSVYSNVKKLVDTDLPSDSVPVIHGLRFFGMFWVIMVHAVFYQADFLNNVPIAYRLSEDIFAQILSNSTYCVDTYLFLSGFLVSYLFFKSKISSKPTDRHVSYIRKLSQYLFMIANRFLRLTPPYVFIILLTDVMYTYYRQSVVLYSSEHNDELCPKYWWRNVLYINNLFPRTEMCLSWSWYLSVDTQFFAVSTFLLILSTIYFKIAAFTTVALILVNIITTAYKSYSIGYIPTMDEQLSQLDAIYDLPWNRIGPYLVGVITAYIFLVKMDRKLILKERTRIFLWVVFPLLNLWILFTLYTRNLSVEFSAFYMAVSRILWGIGIAWLLIACCTGNARALEKFLAFKGFIPLSRLTYCAYLINPLMANMFYMSSEHNLNASISSFSITTQGVAMASFFLAFLLSIFIESPSILLTKMLVNKLSPPKKKDRQKENNTV